jgi:hypothetical protein
VMIGITILSGRSSLLEFGLSGSWRFNEGLRRGVGSGCVDVVWWCWCCCGHGWGMWKSVYRGGGMKSKVQIQTPCLSVLYPYTINRATTHRRKTSTILSLFIHECLWVQLRTVSFVHRGRGHVLFKTFRSRTMTDDYGIEFSKKKIK